MKGDTSLQEAIARRDVRAALPLIEEQAKKTNGIGDTAIHTLATSRLPLKIQEKLLHLLIEHGSEIGKRNNHNKTAADYAKVNSIEFERILRKVEQDAKAAESTTIKSKPDASETPKVYSNGEAKAALFASPQTKRAAGIENQLPSLRKSYSEPNIYKSPRLVNPVH